MKKVLRDVADAVGGFSIGFENSTITITTNEQRPNDQAQMCEDGTPPSMENMHSTLE